MKDRRYLLQVCCVVICFACVFLRGIFIEEKDILYFMLVVNAFALWLSIIMVFVKACTMYKTYLKGKDRKCQESNSYKKLRNTSVFIGGGLLLFEGIFLVCFRNLSICLDIGDYVTIITLGIALADDLLAKIYYTIFRYD